MVPLMVNDIDTDQIIPARFLKVTDKVGLGANLFADWRYNADGSPKESFVLNDKQYEGTQILLAGANFGCGSSREHAPWALCGFGFRCVISTSFADIFQNNALKNGLLPIQLEPDAYRSLVEQFKKEPEMELTVDLASQTVRLPSGARLDFPIDGFSKRLMLYGLDELGHILGYERQITAFEAAHSGQLSNAD
jgi:3-isopropylmalate/(R)-2-methylmalate dehydratase small subunit